eukprot:scaffold21371_cov61-Attheya_sp.AAC.3
MATSRHHATANGANSDQPPNDDIIQTDSAGVHMDTGVDSTSVRHDQRWWQSDQDGISLLVTAASGAVDLPYFHDEDDASSIHTTPTVTPDHPEPTSVYSGIPDMRFHVFLMRFERCSYKHGTFHSQRNGN